MPLLNESSRPPSEPATLPPALPSSKPSAALGRWQKPAFLLFLLVWAVNMTLLGLELEPGATLQWAEGLLLLSAAASTLLTLARRLPAQNVVAAAVLIAAMAGVVGTVAAGSGIPFGARVYSELLGDKFFDLLPWTVPLLWVVVLVNARGVARLIMRPWRKTNYYGYWVIGLACGLAVLLDLGLEPFAVHARGYWIWQTPGAVLDWYTAPWVNFLGWFVTALFILAFSTPWLINKNPVKQPMDYQPLILWLLVNAWLLTGNALHARWLAVAVGLAGNAAATFFAIRGARW